MIIETFPVGWLQCNCTILGDEETKEAIVIDPGDDPQEILAQTREARPDGETDRLHAHAYRSCRGHFRIAGTFRNTGIDP